MLLRHARSIERENNSPSHQSQNTSTIHINRQPNHVNALNRHLNLLTQDSCILQTKPEFEYS